MKIRTRLSLMYLFLTASVLVVFAVIIYVTADKDRESDFFSRLEKEAITKANVYFNAKVDAITLQRIYRSNRQTIDEVEVAIFDDKNNLLYHDAKDIDAVKETDEMLKQILKKGTIRFSEHGRQAVGILYNFSSRTYLLTATAYDKHGHNKLDYLFNSMAILFFIALPNLYLLALYFSKKALRPIAEITENATSISVSNLHLRLTNTEGKDELNVLAQTFNTMLERLENSFDSQKQFISNISHEIRTPLAAIITELELADVSGKSIEEYRTAIKNALKDTLRLVRLSNSLLDLAKASYDPSEIAMKPLRIDELLLDARRNVQGGFGNYKIEINFDDFPEDENQLIVKCNEYLVRVAFSNLMENACKFSKDHQCSVKISFDEYFICVNVIDNGIGISQEDLQHLFTPFFRGDNKKFAEGNGIGLSLTKRIILLHGGTISIDSQVGKGSVFSVLLPHV